MTQQQFQALYVAVVSGTALIAIFLILGFGLIAYMCSEIHDALLCAPKPQAKAPQHKAGA